VGKLDSGMQNMKKDINKHEQAFGTGNNALDKFKEEDGERMREQKNELIRLQTKLQASNASISELD
jgi:hypothetical protein